MRVTAVTRTSTRERARATSVKFRIQPEARTVRVRASSLGLLVVGDDELRSSVERTAPSARRRVVHHVDPSCTEAPRNVGTAWDELVVSSELLDRTRESHPEWVARAARVWLIPPGDRARRKPFASPLPPVGAALKRTMDVVGAIVGLTLCLPIMLLAAAAIRIETRGPVFFTQTRVGAHGRRFRFYKLRTMRVGNDDAEHRAYYASLVRGDASAYGGVYKLLNDARVTRVGRVLRRLSIDEIPQFWNVLRGDMSLVGPRPMQPHELDMCDATAWLRLRVRPGITGAWQVSGRCNLTFSEMVALDIDYWRTWTLRRDIKILLSTPRAVFRGIGAA